MSFGRLRARSFPAITQPMPVFSFRLLDLPTLADCGYEEAGHGICTSLKQAADWRRFGVDLWRRRQERDPVLIVIDEAHNVCPAEPQNPLSAVATEHAIRIAAEGRKFGLYLLLSTQRPQKIPENVLSQADNLVLMRLNSLADAAFAQAVFSFVPPSLIERSATFRQGEALIAGKISPQPALLRFGARISQEGGADVPVTWAAPR